MRCSAKSMRSQTGFFENTVLKLKANTMKRQKVFSLPLLLIEVALTLFIAGIVAPSLLRSDLATKEALALGSSVQSTSKALHSHTQPKASNLPSWAA